jgi:hypothetical protein
VVAHANLNVPVPLTLIGYALPYAYPNWLLQPPAAGLTHSTYFTLLLIVCDGCATCGSSGGGGRLSDEPPEVGSLHRGEVKRVEAYGVFVALQGYRKYGLVHASQVSHQKQWRCAAWQGTCLVRTVCYTAIIRQGRCRLGCVFCCLVQHPAWSRCVLQHLLNFLVVQ